MAARTAVVAGTATAASGRVARRQQRKFAAQEQPAAEPAPAEAGGADPSTAELQQLADLHAQGVITDEEFAAKKKQILGI
jgi:hypothetical protein